MTTAFEISSQDIQNVLSTRFDENVSDEMAESIFDNYIEPDDVESAALHGNEMDEQTALAYKEIESQIRNHWDDINLHLNG